MSEYAKNGKGRGNHSSSRGGHINKKGFHRELTPSIERPRNFKSANERRQAKIDKGGSWTGKESGRARRRDAKKDQREQNKR